MSASKAPDLRHLTVLHSDRLPSSQGVLLLPNRLPAADLRTLTQWLGERPTTFLIEKNLPIAPDLQALMADLDLNLLEFTPEPETVSTLAATLQPLIRAGQLIIHLPTSTATLNAAVTTVPSTTSEFLLSLGLPSLPVCVHHPRDTRLSIAQALSTEPTVFAFGPVLQTPTELTLPALQEALFLLAAESFMTSPELEISLPYALMKGFKKHGTKTDVLDGKDERLLPFNKVFAAAIALSRFIQKETQKDRVCIVLPPGIGGLISNVAVLLAGKTPVNLNFTASHAAILSAMKQSGADRYLSADIFVRKMQAFPWPPSRQLILIERVLPSLKSQITKWFLLAKILPASLLASILGVAKKGGDREALLLFTSGSSGDPKGVVLTHRNVIANVTQFGSRLSLRRNDAVLGCLPLFHSFGCTVTLWYPIIEGIRLVTYPSPLETKRLAELIEKYRVSLLIATPTFLRGYLRGINREQLNSLSLVVTGAEKLPPSVAEAFQTKFSKKVLEGYGLTETSPVTNVNLPDPVALNDRPQPWLPAHRPGSVGQLMPGLAIRITHPDSGAPQPLDQPGMIWFKGPNIFPGYLNDPARSAQVLTPDGWFRTGDIGRVDADGFLYIEGRLSRFSKIGGEMIPHETVEETLNRVLQLENEDSRRIAVVGIPDADRGEALVLLTTLPGGSEQQEIIDLRYRLLEQGVPALWIPKVMKRIPEIPLLASGKLDVQSCVQLAQQ